MSIIATMRSVLPLLILGCALPLPARAASSATLKGVDLYRSTSLTVERARADSGGRLESYLQLRSSRKAGTEKPAVRLKEQIEAMLKEKHKLAFIDLTYGEYVTSAARTAYLTFDVVDEKDKASRMPLRPAPTGKTLDPEGLLAAWQQFSDLGEAQFRQGLLDGNRPRCPGFYCSWPATTPELAALERRLSTGAAAQRKLLEEAAANDADPKKRAAAVFVLSYLPDGNAVASIAANALGDASAEVRGAALVILSDLALYHKSVLIDMAKLLPVLDYPTVSDRGKALSVLVGLVDNKAYRPLILQRALPPLLALLRLNQPNNHDLAFTVLSTLSQESYGRRDYEAWRKWAERQASGVAEFPGVSAPDAP